MRAMCIRHRVSLRALAALAKLALVVGLIVFGLTRNVDPSPPDVSGKSNDVLLYDTIVDRVHHGESYYPAAIDELRDRGYPLRPFVAVRLPTLAWAMAAMPSDTIRRLSVAILALVVIGAWAWRLGRAQPSVMRYIVWLMGLIVGVGPAFVAGGSSLHEVWAGLLIALSMALRRPGAWLLAVSIGTVAALFRELAAPYLVVMALLALWERQYKEAAAWLIGIGVFALALAAHAMQVNELVTSADRLSGGWLQLGGWPFVLRTAQWNLYLLHLSLFGAVLMPLALLGLTARPTDPRLLLTVVGYTAGFLLVGRNDNSYWGFITAPLWPLGWATVWSALAQCYADLRRFLQSRPSTSAAPAGPS